MLIFFTIFIKRPIYTLAFFVVFVLWMMGAAMGNNFPALGASLVSCLFWCYFSLIHFLSDKNVKTDISGVDLKKIVPTSYFFLAVQSIILTIVWIAIVSTPLSFPNEGGISLMVFLTFSTVFNAIIGVNVVLAKIVIEFSRSGIKMEKASAKHIFDDLIRLLSQP